MYLNCFLEKELLTQKILNIYCLFYKHGVFLGQSQYVCDFLLSVLFYAYNMLKIIESLITVVIWKI